MDTNEVADKLAQTLRTETLSTEGEAAVEELLKRLHKANERQEEFRLALLREKNEHAELREDYAILSGRLHELVSEFR